MELVKIKAWNDEIALISEIESKIIFELQDKKFSCFSPIKLEHAIFSETSSSNIDELGLIADSISGAYGKTYFSKYYTNEFGRLPSLLDRLSFIGKNGLGALDFEPSDTSSDAHSDISFSLSDFKHQSIEVYNGNSSNELAKIIAKSNSGAGGAKAKGVVDYNPLTFLMDEDCNWRYSPAYDLTYSGTNSNLNWHQLTIDKKPTTDVRSLGIIKIAKLCDVKNPLEILAQMIEVKHTSLRTLCTKYAVEDVLVDMIFQDTNKVDKTFRRKS